MSSNPNNRGPSSRPRNTRDPHLLTNDELGFLANFSKRFRKDPDFREITMSAFSHYTPSLSLSPSTDLSPNPSLLQTFLHSAHHESTGSFPFLRLPAELRNMIYKQALFYPAGLEFRFKTYKPYPCSGYFRPLVEYSFPETEIALPFVSREVFRECWEMVFEVNELHFGRYVFEGMGMGGGGKGSEDLFLPRMPPVIEQSVDACLLFLRAVSPRLLPKLRKLWLWVPGEPGRVELDVLQEKVAGILEEFPCVQIGLHHRDFVLYPDMTYQEQRDFLRAGDDWQERLINMPSSRRYADMADYGPGRYPSLVMFPYIPPGTDMERYKSERERERDFERFNKMEDERLKADRMYLRNATRWTIMQWCEYGIDENPKVMMVGDSPSPPA